MDWEALGGTGRGLEGDWRHCNGTGMDREALGGDWEGLGWDWEHWNGTGT